ncbi:MAG TPA: DUF898 family protein [Aliiroseovarius sp.]|nr:DUF898 family protein [Aliiroseovarius sp.]
MTLTDLHTDYAGRKGPLFWLAVRTALLTILTLGFYRFWMKTRLRRYYWSAIRPGNVPLEYLGTPWEKLLGFLFAVVILAFYIGIVNLILMYFSFTLFQTNFVAYALSFLGVLPLIFFAQYRARRYILARTRWRGIRFGLEPGAWGYAWRAALHWLATILTGGLLWPRKAFWLEKYRIDRTLYGDQKFTQGGRWTMLIGAFKHVYIGGLVTAAAIGAGMWFEQPGFFAILPISVLWLVIGMAYWQAHSFRLLAEAKTINDTSFESNPRTGRVIGIYVGGYVLTWLVVVLAGALVGAVIGGMVAVLSGAGSLQEFLFGVDASTARSLPSWAIPVLSVLSYFAVFLIWGAASQSFVKLPMARHFSENTRLTNPAALTGVTQRRRDEFTEAEGFADALDVGAAL